ncbi:MAG: nucleotidyltransferase family protein [Bacteroidales bacterium]
MNNGGFQDNDIYTPFMELLRAGLWGSTPSVSLFPLEDQIWRRILNMSRKQTVSAIICDGIFRLPETLHPSFDILVLWLAEVERTERHNTQMNQVLADCHSLFKKAGIPLMLIKGQGVAAFYKNPGHRFCGDIDWYCKSASDMFEIENKTNIRVTNQTRHSLYYLRNGVCIEHHSKLLDIHNPFIRKYIHKLVEREMDKSMTLTILNERIDLPSPLLSIMLVNLHILKHMLSFGIGLRQLCDSACLLSGLNEHIDASELKSIYMKIGIYEWIQVLHEVLVSELGLDENMLPFPRKDCRNNAKRMIQDVWQSGNFGFYDARYGGHNKDTFGRKRVFLHWIRRFRMHLRLAPQESLIFPFAQVLSRILKYK